MLNSNIIEKYNNALKYEIFVKEEYGFAKEKIQKAEYIFDIGGHIGYFSKRCRELNSNAEIHYFEPVKDFYEQAKYNLGNDDKIIFNNFGIGAKKEIGIFLINSEKTMQSSKFSSFLNPGGTEVEVKFYELKKYLKDKKIEKIDIMKMDIEGMEFEVLSSWTDFERRKIQNFIAEIHLLNDEMKKERNENLLPNIKNRFKKIQIIPSEYHESIFLIRATK